LFPISTNNLIQNVFRLFPSSVVVSVLLLLFQFLFLLFLGVGLFIYFLFFYFFYFFKYFFFTSSQVVYLKRYSVVAWLVHVKLMPSQRTFCVRHSSHAAVAY